MWTGGAFSGIVGQPKPVAGSFRCFILCPRTLCPPSMDHRYDFWGVRSALLSEHLSWASTRTLWEEKKTWITLLVFSLRGGPVTRQLAPYAPGDTFAVCFDWFLRPTPKDQSHLRVGRQQILPKVLGIVRTKGENFASSHPDFRFSITLGGWFQTFFVVQPSRDYDPNWLHLVLGFYVLTLRVRLIIFSECPYALVVACPYDEVVAPTIGRCRSRSAPFLVLQPPMWSEAPQLAIEVRLFVRVYDSPQRAKSRGSREDVEVKRPWEINSWEIYLQLNIGI